MNMSNTAKHSSPARKKKKLAPAAKIVIAIAAVILVAVLILGGLVIRKYARLNKDAEDAKQLYNPTGLAGDAINDEVNHDGVDPNAHIVGGAESKPTDPSTGVTLDFKQLYEANSDIKGWITIPNTGLNQPVAQGVDNSTYLYLNHYKKKSALGIPFIDYRATVTKEHISTNLTIYGHAASNGSFFAPVKKYKDLAYYKNHPTLNFNTIYGDGVYKIIGYFMEDMNPSNKKMFNYHDKVELDEAGFNSFISEMNKRNYFTTAVDAKYGDHLVSLSTCDEEVQKGTSTDFRVVLVARKLRDGESAKVDTSKATINKEMVMPDRWVSAKGKTNPYK